MPIKLILADDHDIIRSGIKSVLAQRGAAFVVVGEASSGRELLEVAGTIRADVFLLDIAMPEINGIDAMQEILKTDPKARFLVLSMYDDRTLVDRALRAGARGYVLKDRAAMELPKAIQEVHAGRYYLSPSLADYVIQRYLSTDAAGGGGVRGSPETLTLREREVLKLLAEGRTEKEISATLGIAPNTVHVHRNRLMAKLDIHTLAGLVKYAILNRIVHIYGD